MTDSVTLERTNYDIRKQQEFPFVTNLGKETNNRQTNAAEQNKRIVKYADYISAMKKKGISDERK